MTANTNKSGCVCDICGSPANGKKNKNRGMTLCSSCMGIAPCVDRLDAVVAMMQRTGKVEELLDKLAPHDRGIDTEIEQENHRLKRENEYLVQQLDSRSPYDEALLEWARKRYEAGGIRLKITVEEEAADENN